MHIATTTAEKPEASSRTPSPKRECHKCPLNGKGDDYCWKKCLGPADDSRKGQRKVLLGAMPTQDEYIEREADELSGVPKSIAPAVYADPSPSAEQGVVKDIPYASERYLVQVLASMMSLSDIQLCIFRHIYLGEKMECVGDTLPVRITKQAVSKHIQALRAKHPVFDRMLSQMIRGSSRKPAQTTRPSQTEPAKSVPTAKGSVVVAQLDMFSGVAIGGIYRRGSGGNRSRVKNCVTHTREEHNTPTAAFLSI